MQESVEMSSAVRIVKERADGMLISFNEVVQNLRDHGIALKGILHVGAHDCEELTEYRQFISPSKIIWIEALPHKVKQCRARGILNIFEALVDSSANQTVKFYQTSNEMSSSLLPMEKHTVYYPEVYALQTLEWSLQQSTTCY